MKFTPSKAWIIHVDAVVILSSSPYENILSALSLAAYLALQTTRLPKISTPNVTDITIGSTKYEPSEEYDVDSEWENALPLQGLELMSVIILVSSIDQVIIVDPTIEESSVAQVTYAIGVQASGAISYTRVVGTGGGYASTGRAITVERYIELLETASTVGTKLLNASSDILSFKGLGFFDILP